MDWTRQREHQSIPVLAIRRSQKHNDSSVSIRSYPTTGGMRVENMIKELIHELMPGLIKLAVITGTAFAAVVALLVLAFHALGWS